MDRHAPSRLSGMFGSRKIKSRRPTGVSRRRKKQLGFEALESRQMMAADSSIANLSGYVDQSLQLYLQSYSSATPEGQAELMAQELYWQSLIAAGNTNSGAGLVPLGMPTDPLFQKQWHLVNTAQNVGGMDWQPIYGVAGQDINLARVYEMLINGQAINGKGVRVAVIDSGVQLDHPDLAANIDRSSGFDTIDASGRGGPFISEFFPIESHGTAVAGLIAAVADNGIGGAGVAPGATIIPIRTIAAPLQAPQGVLESLRHAIAVGADITNNSYGRGAGGAPRNLYPITADEALALRDSVLFGRNGLGIINVFSSGNSAGPRFNNGFGIIGGYDSSNYEALKNSRYVIAVTGVDHDGGYNNVDGSVMAYPEAGANVLVAAPTGSNAYTLGTSTGLGSGLWTTDLTGDFGINAAPNAQTGLETEDGFYPVDRDFLLDTDYTSRMNGTSGSAPIVSGVVALMLQVNPNLTWRDVQEILIRSARQNAQFEIPQNGAGQTSQNTWIMNQIPIFHDPDAFVAGVPIANTLKHYSPVLNPNITAGTGIRINGFNGIPSPDHHVAQPFSLTNGAGYTVSQGYGIYQEQIGYGHGTIDAEMAVLLAMQWHEKDQALPAELTFSTFVNHPGTGVVLNIPAAERGNDATGNIIVPGGIGGTPGGGFIAWWNEYYAANPNFANIIPRRGASSIQFAVPDSNAMSVETVEVKISLSGDAAAALDHLRILLVSPSGTYSELNNYWYDTAPNYGNTFRLQTQGNGGLPLTNAINYPNLTDGPGSGNPGQFVWSFTTNRSWGERSDNALVIDAVTGEPVIDVTGILGGRLQGNTVIPGTPGAPLSQGWQLVIENWDINSPFGIQGLEVVWHGSPIDAASKRIQGFVGIDDNRDDNFNFDRTITNTDQIDNDPSTWRLGEIQNEIDAGQERFAANATVTVRRTADNSLVDQFVTGADGNYYFDLIPDDYTISVEGVTGSLKDDAATGSQFLRHYKSEWQITADWFKAWDNETSIDVDGILTREVRADSSGTPIAWVDANNQEVDNGIKGLNFLIDPGPAPAQQVTFTGTVYADTNGDGLFNSNDVALPGITVFGDINRDGVRNSGEISAVTDANGNYTLNVPTTSARIMNVGVVRPSNWVSTNDGPASNDSKTDGVEPFFVKPGDPTRANVNFFIDPPADNLGSGSQPGYLLGVVFADANGDGVRQATEGGAAGFRVYIDNNNSGAYEANVDTQAFTNQFGAYAFGNVPIKPNNGAHIIRLETPSPYQQTQPSNNGFRSAALKGASTMSNIVFGVKNNATLDFGDAPSTYGVASHKVGAYWLGTRVDAELASQHSTLADGDDNNPLLDDEDGFEIQSFSKTNGGRIKAFASRESGYLQAWADWNGNGVFDASERFITNRPLSADANQNVITFAIPDSVAPGTGVMVRFRYGEFATGSNAISFPTGQANTGEVEDWLITVAAASPAVIAGIPADFNQDTRVDGFDFLAWQRNMGRTNEAATQAAGNANGDASVNGADLAMWKQGYGTSATSQAALAAAPNGDFDGDNDVDGRDFLAMQRNFGLQSGATVAQGDANGDGRVNSADVAAWTPIFGYNAAAQAAWEASFYTSGGASSTSESLFSNTLLADAASQWSLKAEAASAGTSRLSRDGLRAAIGHVVDRVKTLDRQSLREFVHSVIADATPGNLADYYLLRRDRAFEDLLGSRRRQGVAAEAELATVDSLEGCDEAFAVLADHVEWPLG